MPAGRAERAIATRSMPFFVRESAFLRLGSGDWSQRRLPVDEARRLGALPSIPVILSSLLQQGLERQGREPLFGTLLGRLRGRDESAEQFVLERIARHETLRAKSRAWADAVVADCERWFRTGRLSPKATRPAVES